MPLCFPEAGSPIADELAQQFTPVVWWATPVEIESALARKLRTGSLSNEQSQEAAKRFEKLATRWEVIDPSDEVLSTARDLLKAVRPARRRRPSVSSGNCVARLRR